MYTFQCTPNRIIHDLFELQGESYLLHKSERSLIVIDSLFDTYTTMVKYANYQDKVKNQPVRALLRLMQGKGADSEIKPCMCLL